MSATYPPIGEQIQLLLESLPAQLGPISPAPALPAAAASIIDHTLLAPSSTPLDIEQCCKEAIELSAATVCVNSSMIDIAAQALKGTAVRPICTIGFPFGAGNMAGKVEETQSAKAKGAQEIDMVSKLQGKQTGGEYAG